MGRPGDCAVCRRRDRDEINSARAGGESLRSLARRLDVSLASLSRHFQHVRPKPRHTPVPVPAAPKLVTMKRIREISAQFEIPVPDLVFHELYCRKGDIEIVSGAEGDEILEMMREHATPEEFAEMFPA